MMKWRRWRKWLYFVIIQYFVNSSIGWLILINDGSGFVEWLFDWLSCMMFFVDTLYNEVLLYTYDGLEWWIMSSLVLSSSLEAFGWTWKEFSSFWQKLRVYSYFCQKELMRFSLLIIKNRLLIVKFKKIKDLHHY